MSLLFITFVIAATPPVAPAPSPAAQATLEAAFGGSQPTTAEPTPLNAGGSGPSSSWTLALPAAVLAGLGATAGLLARKRAHLPRVIRVVETAALGPKRGLALVDVGGELLLLSTAEKEVTLLRVLSAEARASMLEATAAPTEPAPPFEAFLADSAEDQDLRLKLAAGLRGRT